MGTISAFMSVLIILLPIYLWWYGMSMALWYHWNRIRFLMGIFLSGISVFLLYFLEKNREETFWDALFFLGWFLIFLLSVVMILTHFGSPFARGFLRRIVSWHVVIVFVLSALSFLFLTLFPSLPIFPTLFSTFLISSLFEESSKHLISIWLTGHDYRFSRTDILTFTLFSVLGFVFSENIIYLLLYDAPPFEWVYRSLFTLIAHVFSASVCAYFWWKALSYNLFSCKYIIYFTWGFLLALVTHIVYNILVEEGLTALLMIFTVISYMTMIVLFSRK